MANFNIAFCLVLLVAAFTASPSDAGGVPCLIAATCQDKFGTGAVCDNGFCKSANPCSADAECVERYGAEFSCHSGVCDKH